MPLTRGHQGVFRYVQEAVPGTFPTNPTLILPSKQVERVRFFFDKDLKEGVDIDDYEVEEFFSAQHLYGVEVESAVYNLDRVTEFWARQADGAPYPYSFQMIPNLDAATKHYWRTSGWYPKTCTLRSRVGEKWMHRVVFEAGKLTTPVTVDPGVGTGSREAKSAIADALRTFKSGAITLEGAPWAILLDEFEVVIEHGTQANRTTGDPDPIVAGTTFGVRKVGGKANFSLDDGGKPHFDAVSALADKTIVVPFGAAGQPKLTFTGVRLPRFEAELASAKDKLHENQPWRAETYAQGVV